MTNDGLLDIYLVTAPGAEALLAQEAQSQGFRAPKAGKGGVSIKGGWPEVWRANLVLRGANRVLVRIGSYRALHLAQLDKRARQFPWGEVLRADVPVKVEVTCTKSRIYHAGAAAERIGRAITETLGASVSDDADVCVKARISDDLCTISVDTSGALLHKRGHKQAVNKAPLRETLASLFLRQCGYTGKEPVLDPMCGSGTFVIEAAEIAARFLPGRSRTFAFEQLSTFDEDAWRQMQASAQSATSPAHRFYGFDRDAGAVEMSIANAERAGVQDWTVFRCQDIQGLTAPDGPAGLVIVNPPYGGRIGEAKRLNALYKTLGDALKTRFKGWRVGIVTNTDTLAQATGLPFASVSGPIDHGGIRVKVYATASLP